MGSIRGLVVQRWEEARDAVRSTDFEAFANLGSEANRRLVLLLGGGMCLLAAIFGGLMLLIYAGRVHVAADPRLLVAAALLGVVALGLPSRMPMALIDGLIVVGVVVVSVGAVTTGGRIGGYAVLGYLWPVMVINVLRSPRATALHFAGIAAASGGVFLFDDSFSSPLFWWGAIIITLIVFWHHQGWIVRRARTLAVDERRAHARAEAVSEALAAVSEEKSRFLAAMSHELRTPLNAVLGFAEMLKRRVGGPLNDRQREYVDDIVESGSHLLGLIDDTLDEAKIESGEVELDLGEVDVRRLVDDAMRLVRGRAQRAEIELRVAVEGDVGVWIDERRIRQALVNLLANAVKFTPAGGTVTVTARREKTGLVFAVADTGPGIDPAHHETIFEQFHQSGAGSPEGEGTGLGLAVTRGIVELHGGRIWVESGSSEGARIAFVLPGHRTTSGSVPAIDLGESEGEPPGVEVVSAHELMKMTVAFAAWVGVGCLFGALVADTPGVSVAYLWFATGFCVVAGAAGLAVVRHLDEKGTLRVGVAMIIGAGVVTSVGVYYLGPLAPIAALVWVGEAILVRLADLKLQTRGVWWHTLAVSAALAVILAIQPGNDAPAAQWLMVVGTLLLVTFVGSWLVERLEALAGAEQTATQTAARGAAELETASRHKSQFLAGMSHELRTPLNAVIGFAEALQRELAGPLTDHQREYVDDIVVSGRHLLGLINDVLDLAKLDAGRVELTPRTLEVASVVEQAVGVVRPAAEARDVMVEVDVAPGVEVPADEGRLTQAVAALLSNAVRFTPADGAVTVRVRSDGDAVRLVVSDTGPGLGGLDAEAIFEPFHRGTADPSRAAEGSDLRLALARRLVELHGGTLTADSASGGGAVFTALVPKRFPLPGAALDDDAPFVAEAT